MLREKVEVLEKNATASEGKGVWRIKRSMLSPSPGQRWPSLCNAVSSRLSSLLRQQETRRYRRGVQFSQLYWCDGAVLKLISQRYIDWRESITKLGPIVLVLAFFTFVWPWFGKCGSMWGRGKIDYYLRRRFIGVSTTCKIITKSVPTFPRHVRHTKSLVSTNFIVTWYLALQSGRVWPPIEVTPLCYDTDT